ncbi:MAG: TRAP transporter small permease [Deltaproteobacteria bacterium]|nr:TRAP transporter small permease [Deltaproteobacteria bacterium]
MNVSAPAAPHETLFERINRFLVYFSALALCGMAIMITLDVVLRYFFNSPLAASVEASQLIEPWVIFLPFAYTLAVGGHVQVTLVTMRLPRKWQGVCDVIAYGVDFLFFALLCYISFKEFANSFAIGEIMMAAIRLPWWLGKMAMPIGMFLIAVQALFQILTAVNRVRTRG